MHHINYNQMKFLENNETQNKSSGCLLIRIWGKYVPNCHENITNSMQKFSMIFSNKLYFLYANFSVILVLECSITLISFYTYIHKQTPMFFKGIHLPAHLILHIIVYTNIDTHTPCTQPTYKLTKLVKCMQMILLHI